MRIIPRLGSIRVALLIFIAISTGAFAQTETPVNINAADAATLAKVIDGLTRKQAEAIVAFREAHGPFGSFDELVKVDGVGWSLLEANGLTRRPPKEFRDAATDTQTAVTNARVGL